MSKITFRADDDLVRRLEEFDASKSEVMREALRTYLDDTGRASAEGGVSTDRSDETVDTVLAERVDQLIERRLDDLLGERSGRIHGAQDINVNISVDGTSTTEPSGDVSDATSEERDGRKTPVADTEDTAFTEEVSCTQCGEDVSTDHVYCPNCGEKVTQRSYCECGAELRSDWAFCPDCGRRTPAANVLDRS